MLDFRHWSFTILHCIYKNFKVSHHSLSYLPRKAKKIFGGKAFIIISVLLIAKGKADVHLAKTDRIFLSFLGIQWNCVFIQASFFIIFYQLISPWHANYSCCPIVSLFTSKRSLVAYGILMRRNILSRNERSKKKNGWQNMFTIGERIILMLVRRVSGISPGVSQQYPRCTFRDRFGILPGAANLPLCRPVPIALVKCWKVADWSSKKLLANCQKSKKLLPKFQKLPPKFLDIFL